jgi:hypothetical protein
MEWHRPQSSWKKKFKKSLSVGKARSWPLSSGLWMGVACGFSAKRGEDQLRCCLHQETDRNQEVLQMSSANRIQ